MGLDSIPFDWKLNIARKHLLDQRRLTQPNCKLHIKNLHASSATIIVSAVSGTF